MDVSRGRMIFLIGFMGAGKTTLGRHAARRLNIPFTDLDEYIEAQQGCKVQDIFAEKGEAAFRALEAAALQEIHHSSATPGIIATGGGTPCYGDNLLMMKQMGRVIYLRQDPAILTGRLREHKAERPLVAQVPDAELGAFIRDLITKREAWYMQADVVLERGSLGLEGLLEQLTGNS
ncbi:MAG: shikimate kinase [Bacteroidetes bacterium]|nr:MAG: shikimate kinase [Bacteroidota bacterium]